jgi:putative YhdH/YhfP family quinone oxidoreductase
MKTSLPNEAATFEAFRLSQGNTVPHRKLVKLSVQDLSPGDVLIRVAYSSINFKDALASKGLNGIIRSWPRIGGIDFTGTVVESASPRFSNGEEVVVHGFGIGVDHDGGHAQMARVSSEWVMPIPKGLSMFDAAAIGVAGFTAAYSLHLMELNGLSPIHGPVIVTGATGGVASLAIDILSQRGYEIAAMTGKLHEGPYLRMLGASQVLARHEPLAPVKPLEKALWAGALDSVGGSTLAWLTRTLQPEGVIAAFGNAGGAELSTTVLPFILRGIRLLGVNANPAMPTRNTIWQQLAHEYRPAHLQQIARVIALKDLAEHLDRTLAGEARGRTVIDMSL